MGGILEFFLVKPIIINRLIQIFGDQGKRSGQSLFVAEEAQAGTEAEAGFAGVDIAESRKEALGGLVVGVGVDAQDGDVAGAGDGFGVLHESFGYAFALEVRVDGEAMDDDGGFVCVPTDVGVLRFLIGGDGGDSGDLAVNFGEPELA